MTNEKRPRAFNQFNYKPRNRKRLGKRKRLTIPGQSISVKEILAKHSRGMPLPKGNHEQYFGELDVPDFESMDLSEIAEYTKELRSYTKKLERKLREKTEKQTQLTETQAVTEKTEQPDQEPEK